MERWKLVNWIDGYKGIIEVSDNGRVRRTGYTYKTTGRWGTEQTTTKPDKILSPYTESNGYNVIAVQVHGKRKKFLVHRLVARAFVSGFSETLTVNHINGNKTDNRPENLEWVTLAVNTSKQWETGLATCHGDASPHAKLNSGQVRIIRKLLKMGASCGDLASLCGMSPSTIYKIRDGVRWNRLD